MTSSRARQLLAAAILLGVVLRVGAAFYLGNTVADLPGTADQLSYHNLALRVLGGHGFSFGGPWWPATAANAPTAHWSYLYTAYLVGVYALFGPFPLAARLIQAILVGILQPLLVYALGREVFGRSVGIAAAVLVSVYAYFIYYAANLMTEPFYITAILASFWLAIRLAASLQGDGRPALRYAAGLGLALGAAVLLRQLFLLIVPVVFLWVLLSGRRQLRALALAGTIIIAMILPFTAFNYARFHRFVLLNTNAGFAFFWGNHPIYGTHFQPILSYKLGSYQDLIPKEVRGLDEAALDQELLRRGIGFVTQDPVRYMQLSLSRIPAYFMFWPSEDSGRLSNLARVASFGLLWPLMLYGLLISFRARLASFKLRPPSAALLLYAFIGLYTLIHVLTWTLIRYRLPVDAILLIFAGLGAVDLLGRIPAVRRLALTPEARLQRHA